MGGGGKKILVWPSKTGPVWDNFCIMLCLSTFCLSESCQTFFLVSLLSDWDFEQFKYLLSSWFTCVIFLFNIIVSLILSKCVLLSERFHFEVWLALLELSFLLWSCFFFFFLRPCGDVVWEFPKEELLSLDTRYFSDGFVVKAVGFLSKSCLYSLFLEILWWFLNCSST